MKISIDHTSKLPLHVQVEELLRKLIGSPKYKEGALLPKEVELANRLGISRNTIRQATNKLENEGLLVRKKGVGTRVAEKKTVLTGLDHWYSFTKEMKDIGIHVINLELKVEEVPAGKKVAAFFNIDPNKRVIKLSKLKGTGGEPIVFFESYFHPRIGISKQDDFSIPLYAMLENKYGVVVVKSNEQIRASVAGKFAPRLGIKDQDPILVRERFVYDPGNRPIEYNLGYYRSDKFTYSIEILKAQ